MHQHAMHAECDCFSKSAVHLYVCLPVTLWYRFLNEYICDGDDAAAAMLY